MASQHLEAMILRGRQQPRPRKFGRRSPTKGFGGAKKNLLCRVGCLIRLPQQELADEINRGRVGPVEIREPTPLFVVEATMQLVPRVPKLNRC
jgi:hypothetical protein